MRLDVHIREVPVTGPLVADLAAPIPCGVALWWLGQAGFAVRAGGLRLLIDPYLSDVLAAKYCGHAFSHERLMPPPLAPGELRGIDACLSSHAHSDHMDPGTLAALAVASPQCRFVVPRAERAVALARGVPPHGLVEVNAGDRVALGPAAELRVLASAHERLEADTAGDLRHLGFILALGGLKLYHSGDCVPYPGLAETLATAEVDVALLPVNGRDATRTQAGILGNFTFDEAVALCRAAAIPALIAHHVGMFAFNTVPEKELALQASGVAPGLRVFLPRTGVRYEAWRKPG